MNATNISDLTDEEFCEAWTFESHEYLTIPVDGVEVPINKLRRGTYEFKTSDGWTVVVTRGWIFSSFRSF